MDFITFISVRWEIIHKKTVLDFEPISELFACQDSFKIKFGQTNHIFRDGLQSNDLNVHIAGMLRLLILIYCDKDNEFFAKDFTQKHLQWFCKTDLKHWPENIILQQKCSRKAMN